MKRLIIILGIAGILAWTGHSFMPMMTGQSLNSQAGVSAYHEAIPPNVQAGLRILFIGNSYTFYNDMPKQMVEIAKSDPQNTTHYMVKSVTQDGIGLKELWDMPETHQALAEQKWDFVVLQEQSYWAMNTESVLNTYKMVRGWDAEIKKTGARTLLFTTWPRKPASNWYTNEDSAFLRNPEFMLNKFTLHTNALAEKIGAVAIPAGGYWGYVNNAYPDIDLYTNDGSHPGPAGSYLNALLFYRYFAQYPLGGVTYVPPGVSADTAKILRAVVQ